MKYVLTGEMFWDVIPNISTYYQNASIHNSFGKLSFEGGYGVEIDDPENDYETVYDPDGNVLWESSN